MLVELIQKDTFTFKDQLEKNKIDGTNPMLVSRISSCILLLETNHPTLVEIVNQ
jgi:hypothetical protein